MAKTTKEPKSPEVVAGTRSAADRSATVLRRTPAALDASAARPTRTAAPQAATVPRMAATGPTLGATVPTLAPTGPTLAATVPTPAAGRLSTAAGAGRPAGAPYTRQPWAGTGLRGGPARQPGPDRGGWDHRDIDAGRWPGPSTRPRWNGALAATESGMGQVRKISPSRNRMYRRRRRTVLLALVLLVGLVATFSRCGGEDPEADRPAAGKLAPTAAGAAGANGTAPTPAPGPAGTAGAESTGASAAGSSAGTAAAAGATAGRTAAAGTGRTAVTAGSFAFAGDSGPVLGTAGPVRRFAVAVEKGRGVATSDFANAIERTLGDPRSWIAGRQFRLQRVPPGSGAEFTIYLASAATSQQMCAQGGLDTAGYTSCRLAGQVIINLNRWRYAVPEYGAPLATYQAYAINHEVGHQFGHGHEACPGAGRPAPVMQQQTYGLQGCLPNAWPYVEGTRYAGNPVP